MKKLNYTGSSKLKSRIAYLLNRKAPLPLDGNDDPDWGTNGQVLSTDGNGNTAWVNQGGGGSGGHTIENTSGADLPQEDNLQFVGVYTEDDSANDRTKVNIVRQMTKAAMEALSSAEKEGFIDTTDEDDDYIPIAAEDVKLDPIAGMSATTVQSSVAELNTNVQSLLSSIDWRTQYVNLGTPATWVEAWDNLTVYDKPVVGRFTRGGYWWCIALKYTGGQYGMMLAQPYYDTHLYSLSVSGGVKTQCMLGRTVTTLVNESVTIAVNATKTYSALTLSALQAYDELTFMFASGNVLFNGSMTKAQLNMIAGISSGKMYIFGGQVVASGSVSLDYKCKVYANASGLSILNQSVSSSLDKVLIEGITY